MMTGAGGRRFLLLYGSQTGQAKAICEEIAERATDHGLLADIHCLSQTEKKFCLEREKIAVIVISTTGDGEVPDTAQKFWRRLKKTTVPCTHLQNLEYSLLGLGDTNYTNFCNCGKMMDKRILELGATQLHPTAWADDAVGLDVVADPWIDGLFEALKKKLHSDVSQNSAPADTNIMNGHVVGRDTCHDDSNAIIARKDDTAEIEVDSGKGNSPNSVDSNVDKTETDSALIIENSSNVDNQNISNTSKLKEGEISNSIEGTTVGPNGDSDHSYAQKDCNDTNTSENSLENETAHDVSVPSLRQSVPPLSESALSLPVLPPAFLRISYKPDEPFDSSSIQLRNGVPLPAAKSEVSFVTLRKATRLTSQEAARKALLWELNVEHLGWTYEPGDSFGMLCPNLAEEVEILLKRLGVAEQSDVTYHLGIIEGTKKRNASVPNHIPEDANLRYVFTNCCDIRTAPKKAFVRVLVEYTSDPTEKRRLQELASKQGAEDYSKFVREANVSLLDILLAFSSCQPPVERVLEQLPVLQPRAYSACSSLEATPGAVSFVFNVVEFPNVKIGSKVRRGVCTGWLDDLSRSLQEGRDLEDKVAAMSIQDCKIPVYLRGNQYFHAPSDISVPMVMIGPGTGVAPFIGFLQERASKLKEIDSAAEVGKTWLFFGCRNKSHDFLFQKEVEEFHATGILTNLLVSFSRDAPEDATSPRYVQHNLRKHSKEIFDSIVDQNAQIYVCGDAKNMAKDVMGTFVEMFQQYKGLSQKDAEMEVMQLKLKRKYLEDVWA